MELEVNQGKTEIMRLDNAASKSNKIHMNLKKFKNFRE